MSQCQNHEQFMQVALNWGWELWEYGTDSTCIVGGDAPHLSLIWLKPCPWDESQKIPVGCVCCTDLDEELMRWNGEILDVVENRRFVRQVTGEQIQSAVNHAFDSCLGREALRFQGENEPETPPPLAGRPSWLKPYRAR